MGSRAGHRNPQIGNATIDHTRQREPARQSGFTDPVEHRQCFLIRKALHPHRVDKPLVFLSEVRRKEQRVIRPQTTAFSTAPLPDPGSVFFLFHQAAEISRATCLLSSVSID